MSELRKPDFIFEIPVEAFQQCLGYERLEKQFEHAIRTCEEGKPGAIIGQIILTDDGMHVRLVGVYVGEESARNRRGISERSLLWRADKQLFDFGDRMSRFDERDVAALFVRSDSIYKTIPGVDCYDVERGARTWPGGVPAVCHPPCRTWGHLKHFATAARPGEHELGIWAVEQVRKFGGVVEHPSGSNLFRECGCGLPEGLPDQYGGRVIRVDQFHWGHKARKRTLLYIVGADELPLQPLREGHPTHVIDRPGKTRKKERPGSAGRLLWCTKAEREATPPDFALWLVEIARRAISKSRIYRTEDHLHGKPALPIFDL